MLSVHPRNVNLEVETERGPIIIHLFFSQYLVNSFISMPLLGSEIMLGLFLMGLLESSQVET